MTLPALLETINCSPSLLRFPSYSPRIFNEGSIASPYLITKAGKLLTRIHLSPGRRVLFESTNEKSNSIPPENSIDPKSTGLEEMFTNSMNSKSERSLYPASISSNVGAKGL